ncbi:MAG: MHS family MFS transporter [Opitutaceae bacterium]|nr:MHS family MFS transporter [Opitutaceae bacterium]
MKSTTAPAAPRGIWKVIAASSAGTLIEWYDFYIFGSLATIISTQFFPKGNPTVAFLSTLAVFATGFIVRPFGAIVFGHIGDLVGRKYTFLLTLLLMGGSTFAIGLLPTYEHWGVAATGLLVLLRLVQGLALGGEYGGAATYVAEHAPDGRRGFYTSFIQTTATLGLFVSLGVILGIRELLGQTTFEDWGWRLPFLLSIFLIVVSYYIRVRMQESPLFAKTKAEGKLSKNPIKESFARPENRRLVILALLGATLGQGVVWYTGQFYALFFLQRIAGVDFVTVNLIIAAALVLGTPFFIFFGSLSDRIGRKPIIIAGCLLAALLYYPIYQGLMHYANPLNEVMLIALVFVQVLFVTMVYGPIAAFLVELFPTRIRYTSMSLPYHIGNGVFGGLVPFIATALVAKTGNPYAGLIYPIGIALTTAVIGGFFLKEKRHGALAD